LLACLLHCTREKRKPYVYTLVRHTRGWIPGTASDRPLVSLACLLIATKSLIAILSGKPGRKPKGQNRPCLVAFLENPFLLPLLLPFQRYWLSNAFFNELLPNEREEKPCFVRLCRDWVGQSLDFCAREQDLMIDDGDFVLKMWRTWP
jgi:hypothetical protein